MIEDVKGEAVDRWVAQYRNAPAGTPARNEAYNRLAGLAKSVIDRTVLAFTSKSLPSDEIRQLCMLGLLEVIDRYDPERGSFSGFAYIVLRGRVLTHLKTERRDRKGEAISYHQVGTRAADEPCPLIDILTDGGGPTRAETDEVVVKGLTLILSELSEFEAEVYMRFLENRAVLGAPDYTGIVDNVSALDCAPDDVSEKTIDNTLMRVQVKVNALRGELNAIIGGESNKPHKARKRTLKPLQRIGEGYAYDRRTKTYRVTIRDKRYGVFPNKAEAEKCVRAVKAELMAAKALRAAELTNRLRSRLGLTPQANNESS